MFALTAFGDIVIGLAAFAAGVYFADWTWKKIKCALNWIKARF